MSENAQRRGIRGLSVLVQAADLLLGLEGMLTESDAREVRTRIDEVKSTWRASWSSIPIWWSIFFAAAALELRWSASRLPAIGCA
ncbi:hypothetical protein H7H78_16215 [Mycobacterium shinjukuense]|nr:hypothetical protein [Mycobacterium shinjukuense]